MGRPQTTKPPDGGGMNLGRVLRAYRIHREQTIAATAREIGVTRSVLNHVEIGYTPEGSTLAKMLGWLMQPPG